MTENLAAMAGGVRAPEARLEPDAIGVAQDTVIGMANAAPGVSVGLTLAALAAATAYGSGPIILLTAIPMLIIANAYRRLNLWNANCGASFEWVGRSINPYLGFMTGWLMVTGSLIGTVSGVIVLAPSVLAIFGSNATSTFDNVVISTLVILVMLTIAILGIRLTAQTQVGFAAIEYVILIGFAIVGLAFVLGHHAHTVPVTSGWFSPTGVGGHGDMAAGFLAAVFMYTGWDGTVYVNEETKHRRVNPGRAAMLAVIFLAIIFTFVTVGLQGVLGRKALAATGNDGTTLVAVAHVLGGSGWEKVMALALALSVIGSTGTGIVLIARLTYGMASHRTLPEVLSNVSQRFHTPAVATAIIGLILIIATWLFLLTSSIQNAFFEVVDVTGILYAAFYVLTAFATIVYFRRRVIGDFWSAVVLGVLPLAAAAFLIWLLVKSVMSASGIEDWTMIIVLVVGVILLFIARFGLRSSFFRLPRESDAGA
ncbi:MAG TPA: APC family permease [Streptosporangiaceae bacterium]|nr:APC family permease [Streptosporangiaceae bacterium]